MNVVIVHCHFERGGVTQVVCNHVRAILQHDPAVRITLLSGSRIGDLDDQFLSLVQHAVVAELDYDDRVARMGWSAAAVDALAASLAHALDSSGCSPDDTVIHWHNHALGKNTPSPTIIRRLADRGWRFLLQIHDFAEDYRPENLKRILDFCQASTPTQLDEFLYPSAPAIHYATLTSADQKVVGELGVEAGRRHTLPNAVALTSDRDGASDDDSRAASLRRVCNAFGLPHAARWSVYPVRGIRRKNVGEMLLLSRLMPSDVFTGITLCPTTETERTSYRRWQAVAKQVAPRVVFDAGQHEDVSFEDNLNASDFVVSTSVAEGFGMVFLEPWLAGRGVVARRIASATDDFVAAGMQLDRLYDSIWIPGDRTWLNQVASEYSQARRAAFSGLPSEIVDGAQLDSIQVSKDDAFDFAGLTPIRQVEVLQRCKSDSGFMNDVCERAANICGSFDAFSPEVIAANQACIAERFSLEKQGVDLSTIYDSILAEEPSGVVAPANAGAALASVTELHPFFPCRTEVLDS